MLLDVVYWKRAICYTIYTDGENVVKKGTTKKSITTIAKEVIAGKWGNGEDRKNSLIKAGYKYDDI